MSVSRLAIANSFQTKISDNSPLKMANYNFFMQETGSDGNFAPKCEPRSVLELWWLERSGEKINGVAEKKLIIAFEREKVKN